MSTLTLEDRTRILASIIYSMDSFKASTVIRRFRSRTGSAIISFSETVQNRLDSLVEHGAIREIGDRYVVRLPFAHKKQNRDNG